MSEQLYAVVFGDGHSEYDRIARTVEVESSIAAKLGVVVKFIFDGDFVDGPQPKKTIDFIMGLEAEGLAEAAIGNHEIMLSNALNPDGSTDYLANLYNLWRPSYEFGMFEAYGLSERTDDVVADAKRLADAMAEAGHKQWIDELPPYLEYDDFVVVHAGPNSHMPWRDPEEEEDQARLLQKLTAPKMRMSQKPEQIFDHDLAMPLAVPLHISEKTFVTGHQHLKYDAAKRRNSRRIALASNLFEGAPLYIWRSATDEIVTYPQD